MTLVLTGFQFEDPVSSVSGDMSVKRDMAEEVKKKKNEDHHSNEMSNSDRGSESSATLEDILDATLADNIIIEEDEEDEDEDEEEDLHMEKGRLNRTPLRNGVFLESPRTPDSGETVRFGSMGGSDEFIMPMLGATMSHTNNAPTTPKLSPPAKVSHKKSASNIESSPRGLGIGNTASPGKVKSSPTSASAGHSRKSSSASGSMVLSSPSRGDEKKSSRSLSKKFNDFFSSRKSNPHSRTPSADMDTHSGWGVSSSNSKTTKEPQVIPRTRKPTDRRGKSDSLILSAFHLDKIKPTSPPPPASTSLKPPVTPKTKRSHSGTTNSVTSSSTHRREGSSRSGSVGISFNVTQPLADDTTSTTTGSGIGSHRPNTELGHKSSNSMGSVSASNSTHSNPLVAASIYRTPPLNTLPSFEKAATASATSNKLNLRTGLNTNNVKEERRVSTIFDLSAADDGLDSPGADLYSNELLLRKLKIEIRELKATKKQLRDEIEHLTVTRDSLTHEVENFKQEKEKSSMSSYEIFDSQPGDVHSDTSRKSSSSANKLLADSKMEPRPKFWKIFGNNSRSSNNMDGSSGNTSLDTVFQNQMSLVEVCDIEGSLIPLVIRICLAHLEAHEENLKSEGLYRKSASSVLVENIEKEMNEVDNYFVENPTQDVLEAIKETKLLELMDRDEHAVAGVLKRYLRHFPEPLLMYSIYEPLMNLVKKDDLTTNLALSNGKVPDDYRDEEDKEEKGKLFRTTLGTVIRILNDLPKSHYETLKAICKHLILVSSFSESNLMTIRNLAIVFSPSLIHDENGDKDFADMKERYYLIEFILGQTKEIFD